MGRVRRLVVVRCVGGGLAVVAAIGVLGSPALAAGEEAPRYRVDATVIEENDRGPRACWEVLASRPPQCGAGIPLDAWRWADAPRFERTGGTTWGDYRLVGTYDGARFRVENVTRPRRTPSKRDIVDFRTPCDPPQSGWTNRDEGRLRIEDAAALADAARSSPDFVLMWPDRSQTIEVTNVAFTSPVEAHRAALENLWGGPLCVLQFKHSTAELLEIQSSLTPDLAHRIGIQMTGSYLDETRNRVAVGALAPNPAAQARLDRRYGRGLVVLNPWLEKAR